MAKYIIFYHIGIIGIEKMLANSYVKNFIQDGVHYGKAAGFF